MFEYFELLTTRKTKWEELTDQQRKDFSPFVFNKVLGTNPDWIHHVNRIQVSGISNPEWVYQYYLELLPNRRIYTKFLRNTNPKPKKEKEQKRIQLKKKRK